MKKNVIICLATLLLCACGFHLRNHQALPHNLQQLNVQVEKNHNVLRYEVKQSLRALGVTLSHQPARYTLEITDIQFTHDNPSITSTTNATTYNYNLSLRFSLRKGKNHTIIAPKQISANEPLLLGSGQIYNETATNNVKQRLQDQLVSLLLEQLSTDELKRKMAS